MGMKEIEQTLRLSGLALEFVRQSETLPVLMAWARKEHNAERGAECTDPECMFTRSPKEWREALEGAFLHCVTMLKDADEMRREAN